MPLRILAVGSLYPPHHLGGYELIWQSAMRRAEAQGHQVRILCSDHGGPSHDNVHRELRWYWRDHEFPELSPLERARVEWHNMRTLQRHIRQFRPHVVNWWAMGGMSISLVERIRKRPAVGVVCDDWMLYGPEVDQWLKMIRRKPRLARAAHWLFISETTRDRALQRFDLRSTGLAPAGVDPAVFTRAPERAGWDGRLLYVGRIDPRKGIDTAVDALPDGATLDVVGSGDEEHLAALRERAGERVRFRPLVPRGELAAVYAGSDAVVFPVNWVEPWGLVPLEAMAVGRPVIATGMGGSGEYLRHEENCLLVPPADPPALRAAIERLAGDPALRSRLREGGFATAARYTEQACNETILAALERAVKNP